MEDTMKKSLETTAKEMITSLKEYAEDKGITVEQVRECFKTLDTDGLNSLDDLFQDNGEGRVDYFSWFSMDYARQFSDDVTSDEYDERRWEVEVKAMKEF